MAHVSYQELLIASYCCVIILGQKKLADQGLPVFGVYGLLQCSLGLCQSGALAWPLLFAKCSAHDRAQGVQEGVNLSSLCVKLSSPIVSSVESLVMLGTPTHTLDFTLDFIWTYLKEYIWEGLTIQTGSRDVCETWQRLLFCRIMFPPVDSR